MNKLYILALLLPAFCTASADPVKFQAAQQIANQTLGGESEYVTLADGALRRNCTESQTPAFYIFNRTEGGGFVIVSGDDAYPSVLAYGSSTLTDATPLPEGLRYNLEHFADEVERLQAGLIYQTNETRANRSVSPVLPMVTTQWNQQQPYNYYLPTVNGKRTATGCIATAMAQIMNYWEWPAQGQGTQSFMNKTYDYSKSTYQWNLMRDTYKSTDDGTAEGNAVAQLMLDAGTSVFMDYGVDGSGANDTPVSRALVKFFKYCGSTIEFKRHMEMKGEDEWESIIYRELSAGRPLLATGASVTGSGADAAGHAYVFDGCDARGYVHVNWGWSGVYDGFYSLTLLNPASYSFIDSQALTYGIKPDYDGTDGQWQGARLTQEEPLTTIYKSLKKNAVFTVTTPTLLNANDWDIKVVLGLGLYDLKGNLLENLTYNKTLERTMKAYTGLGNMTIVGMPRNTYADGDYVIRIIALDTETGNWLPVKAVGGDAAGGLAAKSESGVLYPGQVTTGIDDVDGGVAAEIVSVRYYDLSGAEISAPVRGQVYIERQILSNGTEQSVKRIAQ